MADPLAITLTALEGAGLVALTSFLGAGRPQRKIFYPVPGSGTPASGQTIKRLVPQVVVDEHHSDVLVITEHPVEQGAAISDHAYKRPAELTIRAGWSEAGQFVNPTGLQQLPLALPAMIPQFGAPNYLNDLYNDLLVLQANRQMVSIITGKRSYASMLLHALQVHTDEKTETTLLVTASFRQVLIVQTQVIPVPQMSQMAQPQKTAPVVNQGSQQALPAANFNATP
jgi:hypothetical protein